MKKKTPAPVRAEPTGIYVKLPIAPDLLEALAEHAENVARLRELASREGASLFEIGKAAIAAAETVSRDVTRVRSALRQRRSRR